MKKANGGVKYEELIRALEKERTTKRCGYAGNEAAEKVCEFCKWIAKNQEDIFDREGL